MTAKLPDIPSWLASDPPKFREDLDGLMGHVHGLVERWNWRAQQEKLAGLLEDLAAEIREEVSAPAAMPRSGASGAMFDALRWTLAWLTNVNAIDEADLVKKVLGALQLAGMPQAQLDAAAVALLRGAARRVTVSPATTAEVPPGSANH